MSHVPLSFVVSHSCLAFRPFVLNQVRGVILVRVASLPHFKLQLEVFLIGAIFIAEVFIALKVRLKLHKAVRIVIFIRTQIRSGMLCFFLLTVALSAFFELI
jgi:hypothetical protein